MIREKLMEHLDSLKNDLKSRLDLKSVPAKLAEIVKDMMGDPEEIIVAVEAFYDEHIDLPAVPNLVEPLFDKGVRLMIRPTLYLIFAEKAG